MGTAHARRSRLLMGMVVAAILVLACAPAAEAGIDPDKNHPEYWQDLGYGTCVKQESPGTPYTLGAPPAGSTWTMLVVKAGSDSSTNDPHAEYPNPAPGTYYHPSGKTISHIIRCYRSGSTTSTTTTTTSPNDCGTYTPRQLAANKASVEPGDTLTITGVAGKNDTLTFTISGSGVSTTTLGTTQTAPNGSFSFTGVIPDNYPAGTFTITVKSKICPRSATLSIVTQSVNRSGCGTGNPLTLVRGQATSWKLITGTPPFNTAKPVTLTLTQRATNGVSYTLSTGTWPSTGAKTITVPANAPLDRYFLVQSGSQQGNNKARTESCPIRVTDPPPPATASVPPAQPIAVGAAGGLILFALHRRRNKLGGASQR